MSRCKCSKSDVKVNEHSSPYLEDITTRMEERRCDLIGKQKYLRDKITTMERSIPALMAYNMWMAGQNCNDAPYCKVREIMKQFSPDLDPTEKLLDSLKKTVTNLNGETADLHEKIIDADVKLEETDMELESLELVNKEMNDTLNDLEKEVRSYTTPSLHSIHSEDLLCLSKIKQLAKEELNLKGCIKELEKKEMMFRDHMDQLLASKGHRNICSKRKLTRRVQGLECNEKRMPCTLPMRQQNDRQLKKRVEKKDKNNSTDMPDQKDQEKPEGTAEKRSSWISNWWNGNQKTTESSSVQEIEENEPAITENDVAEKEKKKVTQGKMSKSPRNEVPLSCKPCGQSIGPPASAHLRSCRHAANLRTATVGKSCSCKYISTCNVPCKKLFTGFSPKGKRNPFGEPPWALDQGFRQICKPSTTSTTAPCELGNLCEICPSTPCKECSLLRPGEGCRCNCKGKCSRGLSDVPCGCGLAPVCPADKGYQPRASKLLNSDLREEDSNSDDEFCECCACGCEDSDTSLTCNCDSSL